jgi:hypothetical protein
MSSAFFWRAASDFCSANFVVIPAQYTRAPKTATDNLEHNKKRTAKGVEKESIYSTHP